MERSNAPQAPLPRWEELSASIFVALLLLYPARFRRIYGAQMAQDFRASLRAAAQRGGAREIAHVWRRTLGDLLVTALAEQLEEDRTMERLALYRATGMVSLVGVGAWVLGSVSVALGLAFTHMVGGPPPLAISMVLPTAWMFFVVGFIGLYTRLAERCDAIVWLPGIIAISALLAMMVGAMYWTYGAQVGVQYTGSVTIVTQPLAVDQRLDEYAYAVSNLGIPAMGLALIVTAWLTRQAPDLRAITRMLLVMGAISAAYYFFSDMGAPSLLRNTGMPGLIGMEAGALAFAVVWLSGWVLLGRWLWKAGAIQPAREASAPGSAN